MNEEQKYKLRSQFVDISRGFGVFQDSSFGILFNKHLGLTDSANLDQTYRAAFNSAKEKGIFTNQDKLDFLIQNKQWDIAKDKRTEELKDFIGRLRTTKSKLILKSQIEGINKEIEQYQEEINEILHKKFELMGTTAETLAQKKVSQCYIINSFFKDNKLRELRFSQEEFDNIDEEELGRLISYYNEYSGQFNDKNLKRIALLPEFFNLFCISGDNPYYFYGKFIINLTFYQAELFNYGRYFKNILSEIKGVDNSLMDDPDKLIEWYDINRNAQNVLDNNQKEGGAVSLVGATANDLKALNADAQIVDLNKIAKDKGKKRLNFQDLLEIQGVKGINK